MNSKSYLAGLGLRSSNYDKAPAVAVPAAHAGECWSGWDDIAARIGGEAAARGASVVAVECYPGVHDDAVRDALAARLAPALVITTADAMKTAAAIDALASPFLGGDDPVFGRLCTSLEMANFFDDKKADAIRARIASATGTVLVAGPGAALLAPAKRVLVYADMPRWEGQLRQRRGEVDNLGARNRGLKASLQYKRSFFIDWRVADRLKRDTMDGWDFLLDTTAPASPKLISGVAHLAALRHAATRPFRVVPFFDPGPWGGQWMREVCGLPDGPKNYAWCFDCVPEENSLLLEFAGGARVEIPSVNLVFSQPRPLLGEAVYGRFGREFPIRFDFLDTMRGGNLSFQVHPLSEYAREQFGIPYTQDESYYILDAEPGAVVYLGHKDGAKPGELLASLEAAQAGGAPFDDAKFAARFPAKKHDHFLIPAGTLHCSGAGSMVLEISATPYIFTFKLWDWARLGLDGLPRPVNVERGKHVIQWHRDETHARENLVNQVREVARGEGWVEERTGLHEAEFIETRRHWFSAPVPHHTGGGVNVLNLVEGAEAVVESPSGAFEPFTVHYAETFIVPASVGDYTIRPAAAGARCATMKAFVRTRA
ncbi:class I mannose-6-phosphate isomerase [Termitidicoccus mucosus]|uniref:Mannose-6-phosphate isomerase n=1 Tax=Termitidicoccus mucosus TaxID=1184151 RepID=A0A178IJ24_9BACT|nr:mannose-6-phosphate isomerase [Opitutaceae bacterium TSB47]